jgi:hypothetical protein
VPKVFLRGHCTDSLLDKARLRAWAHLINLKIFGPEFQTVAGNGSYSSFLVKLSQAKENLASTLM